MCVCVCVCVCVCLCEAVAVLPEWNELLLVCAFSLNGQTRAHAGASSVRWFYNPSKRRLPDRDQLVLQQRLISRFNFNFAPTDLLVDEQFQDRSRNVTQS